MLNIYSTFSSITNIVHLWKNIIHLWNLVFNHSKYSVWIAGFRSVYYPHNYGFIPKTYCDDNDPLDILVLSQIDVVPLCIVPAKIIGVMRMMDNGEADDKIIAVAENDMSVNHFEDIEHLPPHFIKEIRSFFEDYKKLEHKEVIVEDFLGKEIAIDILNESFALYDQKFR